MDKDSWSVIFSHCDEATKYSLKNTCKDFSELKIVHFSIILNECCKYGYLSILSLILQNDVESFSRLNLLFHLQMEEIALANDQFDILQFLYIGFTGISTKVIERAAYLGRLDILEWYYERNPQFFEKITNGRMIRNSRIEEENPINLLRDAILCGHISVCNWLYDKKFRIDGFIHYPAAIEGRKIEMLDWVYLKIGGPYESYFQNCAKNCTIEIIEWLDSKYATFSKKFFYDAIRHGRLDILEWMKSNGKKLEGKLCSAAIEKGNMDILEWLHENDYPWDKNSFNLAWTMHTVNGISESLEYYTNNL